MFLFRRFFAGSPLILLLMNDWILSYHQKVFLFLGNPIVSKYFKIISHLSNLRGNAVLNANKNYIKGGSWKTGITNYWSVSSWSLSSFTLNIFTSPFIPYWLIHWYFFVRYFEVCCLSCLLASSSDLHLLLSLQSHSKENFKH